MIHTAVKADPETPLAALRSVPARDSAAISPAARAARVRWAETLWRGAPIIAATTLFATVIVTWLLRATTMPVVLAGWAVAVIGLVAAFVRARRITLERIDEAHRAEELRLIIEAMLLAGLWASLPLASFFHASAEIQALLAATVALMLSSGLLLAGTRAALIGWMFTLGLPLALLMVTEGGLGFVLPASLLLAFLAQAIAGSRVAGTHQPVAAEPPERSDVHALLLREYEEHGAGWLWQIDAHNRLTYLSPRFSTLLGRPIAQLMGHSLPVLLGPDSRLGGSLVSQTPFADMEFAVDTPSGARWITLSGNPVRDQAGTFLGYRGVGMDITESHQNQGRLTHLAASDMLTGLANRQRVRELLDEALVRAAASGRPCALLYLDLDGFKPVNDSFGHARGDAVLRAVGERLAEVAGPHGQVGRMGGDEFAIILHDADNRRNVEDLATRVIAAIGTPYPIDNLRVRIGVSIGCAYGPIDADTTDDLIHKADLALYLAKHEGRGAFRAFDAKMQKDADHRLRIESDLRIALDRDQFTIYYQPIVSSETRAIVGFEALLRWFHPELGEIPPMRFIPVAEETGLIGELGEWVIRTATRDASAWPDHVFVSVNLSPRQLVLPALPNTVSEALSRARLAANRLELEVTESVFMDDTDGALDVLRRVRGLGVGIALDDFGTGYSSLGYLNKTIFHKLKIDGSFVRDAGERTETVAIIRAIVDLANSFRMTITAEGVEKAEDFTRMRDLGCHQVQGYLLGRPMPYDKTLELVGTRWEKTARLA